MKLHPGYYVAVFGGAVAGSQAADLLAKRGIYTAVFEQNTLPYGKIEDGLPKWHVKLRDKEERKTDQRLSQDYVQFIPKTALGREVSFKEIVQDWGFSAVLLAIGSWRDRPLPVEGVDEYVGKGLYYQNPFVEWFNHHHEPNYRGEHFEIKDDAIVVGGGLASIDVVKIVMLETTQRALAERGFNEDILTLEREGIPRVLERLNLSFEDLGIKGCTLYYRRRIQDMPLSSLPPGATPEQMEKVYKVRIKILENARRKYLFRVKDLNRPVDKIVENGRLAGLVFQKTRVENGRVVGIEGSEFEVRSPLVISSIGSIPKPIEGIPMEWELYKIKDKNTGELEGYPGVFALGNTVTGKGNIRESELHSRKVVQHVLDNYLKWSEVDFRDFQEALSEGKPLPEPTNSAWRSTEEIEKINRRIREAQKRVGYDGNYRKWIEEHKPVRLEEMIPAR